MHWDQFASGLKQLIAKVASSQSLAPENDSVGDGSTRSAASVNDAYDDERTKPYVPDNRSDSSLHLSC